MLPFQRILCPTDFSEPSYLAVDKAAEFAAHFGAQLCLLHVMQTPHPLAPEVGLMHADDREAQRTGAAAMAQQLDQTMQQRVPAGVAAHTMIGCGDAAEAIVDTARDTQADLIVIATHGLTGWRRLVFGSVAERVVQTSSCPVLTVHGIASEPVHKAESGMEAERDSASRRSVSMQSG